MNARPPAPHDHLERLERDECIRRLEAHGVGRIGVVARGSVGIFPVNYVVAGDSIVVRVRRDGAIEEGTHGVAVAVEIDHADSMYHEGWSVLVQGHCVHVTDADEIDALEHLPLLPWGDSERDLYLRVSMESVSGRHLHHRAV
jgi:nitroimidazol reductase NimA-like FMN-containing flavoprotein (pyridoxamine 5'-phosphate oxidase superfamily)